MADELVSGLITTLHQPGSMLGLEEERLKFLNLLQAIRADAPPAPSDEEYFAAESDNEDDKSIRLRDLNEVALEAQFDNEDEESICLRDLNVMEVEAQFDNEDKESIWLRDLKEVVSEADGILTEFRCAELQAEAETERRQGGDQVRAGLFCHFKVSNIKLPFLKKGTGGAQQGDESRIHSLVLRIDNLVTRALELQQNQGIRTSAQQPQVQIFQNPTCNGPITVGIDEQKEKIVKFLLDPSYTNSDTIVTVSIIGGDGAGKTTLAQSICKDAGITNHFECIIWVDIGRQHNFFKVAKMIIDQVIGKDCCLHEDDTDLLQRRLYQELSGKRYLLVWDYKWDIYQTFVLYMEFKSWLQHCGGRGNSLIVLFSFGGDVDRRQTYNLKHIINKPAPADMMSLFAKNAFADGQKPCTEILEFAKKIVSGNVSPQLVNMMGSMMRFMKDPAEWRKVIKYWECSDDYPPLYKLCVLLNLHLSSEMKQCLTFCFVFPRGCYIDKEILIELWIANGLFSSDGSTSLEEKGNIIFNELVLRHIFEDVKNVPSGKYGNKHEYGRVVCKLAEILYTYSLFFTGAKAALCYNDPLVTRELSNCRYLSMPDDLRVDIPEVLNRSPNMRTLLFLDDPFVTTVNCSGLPENSLRALQLHSAQFDKNLFELRQLTPLRYLDLSGSRITKLPEDFSSLTLLQTLNLSRCLILCELPEDMRCMRNLIHIYVHGCPKLKKMPVHLGQLRNLTTLTTYIIGESTGNGIDELKGLNLSGLLELYNLSKVENSTIAREVNLLSKTNLKMLTLCWGRHRLVMSKANNDLEVLEALQPHNGLKVLKIQQYRDLEFATWLANPVGLLNLVELHLIGCPKCETLPAVWKLSSLRVLCLKHMPSIAFFSSIDSSEPFPSLNKLILVSMKKLGRWHDGEVMPGTLLSFPVLNDMEITQCPVLETMPNVPVLKYLTISTENHRLVSSVINLMSKSEGLIEVNMANKNGSDNEVLLALGAEVEGHKSHKLRIMRLDSINTFFMTSAIPNLQLGFWRSLESVENLDISNCNSIINWPLEEFKNMRKLKRLSLRMCPKLTGLFPRGLHEGEELLPQLQSLEFYRCLSLEKVPPCSSIIYLELDECPRIDSISALNNLEMLFLSCTSWKSLPAGFGDLVKLKSLRVSECYSLTSFPNELAGLISLQTFIISKCPKIKSLPGGLDQMLRGLEKFRILECPELEKFCSEEPYSSIISQIGERGNAVHVPSGSNFDESVLPDDENQLEEEQTFI